jgi:hypothetical protein
MNESSSVPGVPDDEKLIKAEGRRQNAENPNSESSSREPRLAAFEEKPLILCRGAEARRFKGSLTGCLRRFTDFVKVGGTSLSIRDIIFRPGPGV